MRRYDYEEFLLDIKSLCKQISDTPLDAIVAVARGGMAPAHFLSMKLNIRNVSCISCVGYDGTKKLSHPVVGAVPHINEECETVLIVDEIVDSGQTLALVKAALQATYPEKVFLSATIFQKPDAPIKADFCAQETQEWIEFFWEE